MEVEHEHARQRRPRVSLTRRQREVLARIVDGKTNGEIAEELGISLDGVKYHVREIFALLGVDTREEAAEWWRQQHGLRARMSVAANLVRMPLLARLGFLGGGGAAAIAGVVAIAAMAGSTDTVESPLEPGVWTVLAEPIDEVVCSGGSLGDAVCEAGWSRLVVLDEHGIEERQIGEPANWTVLRWSPDGRSIAAIERVVTPDGVPLGQLHVFDLATGKQEMEPISGSWSEIEWSADSGHLLLTGPEDLTTYARSLANATKVGHGKAVWSADDSRLLIVDGDDIRITDPSGRVLASGSVAEVAGQLNPAPHAAFAIAIEGSNFTLGLAGGQRGGEVAAWRVDGMVDGASLSWSPAMLTGIDELAVPFQRNGNHHQILAQRVGAFGGACRGSCMSPDGRLTYLLLFEEPSDADTPYNAARHPRYVGWAADRVVGWFASDALARSKGATPLDLVYVPD